MKLSRFLTTPTGGVTRASAPVSEEQTIPTDPGTILAIALDVGAETLRVGGEIHRVEDTVTRICRAYGAEAVEALAAKKITAQAH